MNHVFVITDCEALADSLYRYFVHTRAIKPHVRFLPPGWDAEPATGYSGDPAWRAQAFEQVADWMEESVRADGGTVCDLRNSIVFISLQGGKLWQIGNWNPLSSTQGRWPPVVGMLVMSFPEVHWVFDTSWSPTTTTLQEIGSDKIFRYVHVLGTPTQNIADRPLTPIIGIHEEGFVPLFDPSGLRHALRSSMVESEDQAPALPLRHSLCAAIDEEKAYVYLSAYAAYRQGFRGFAVTSDAMMCRLFKKRCDCPGDPPPVQLTFEDLFLQFPDRPSRKKPNSDVSVHLSSLRNRDDLWVGLKEVRLRVFATVGHHRGQSLTRQDDNSVYLDELQKEHKHEGRFSWNTFLYKPFTGIISLWQRTGLDHLLKDSKYRDLVESFRVEDDGMLEDAVGSHSAKGPLLQIADRLIVRAKCSMESARTVPDAIHGALLALDAYEMLEHKTPTESLEALSLQHQLEVTAECMFFGVEHHLNVHDRLKETRREVEIIGRWFREKTSRLSVLAARLSIVNQVLLRFRQYNQFDEEEVCLIESRDIQRSIWFWRNTWWAWIGYPIRWYIDQLLVSVPRFIAAMLIWIATLGFLFDISWSAGKRSMLNGLYASITAFMGMSAPEHTSLVNRHGPNPMTTELYLNPPTTDLYQMTVMLAIIVGFLHIGIFISHLYSRVSRR